VEQVGASQHAKFARGFEPRTTFSSRQVATRVATPLPNFCENSEGHWNPNDSLKESRDALVTHSSTFPHATRIVFRAFDRSPSELGDSLNRLKVRVGTRIAKLIRSPPIRPKLQK
jgi:hypothetical protein